MTRRRLAIALAAVVGGIGAYLVTANYSSITRERPEPQRSANTASDPTASASDATSRIHDPSTISPEGASASMLDNSTFEALRAKADAGDVAASLEVGRMIWKCREIPVSVDEHNLTLSKLPVSEQPPQANYNVEIERIRSCEDVPRDDIHITAGHYYKFAADSGDLDAIYEYATILPFLHGIDHSNPNYQLTDKQISHIASLDKQAIGYLTDAAVRGDLRSAVLLAAKHEWGFSLHPSPRAEELVLRESDLFEAYAWYYAVHVARGGSGGHQVWREKSLRRQLSESGLLEEAREQGQKYYEQYFAGADATGG